MSENKQTETVEVFVNKMREDVGKILGEQASALKALNDKVDAFAAAAKSAGLNIEPVVDESIVARTYREVKETPLSSRIIHAAAGGALVFGAQKGYEKWQEMRADAGL